MSSRTGKLDAGDPAGTRSGNASPSELKGGYSKFPKWARPKNGMDRDAIFDAMLINDSQTLDETDRERELTEIFAERGIKLEFYG